MKRIIFPSIIMAVLLSVSACVNMKIKKADEHYEHFSYSKAIELYESVYDKSEDYGFKSRLANSYIKIGDYNNAAKIYDELLSSEGVYHRDYLRYAKVLISLERYSEADKMINEYLILHPDDVVAQMMFSSINSINDRYRDTTLYELKPIQLEDFQNTFGIQKYKDGVVFNADDDLFIGRQNAWTGMSYLNLYYMEKDTSGEWLSPVAFKGDLSGRFHDGPATFSEDEKTVYFTRSDYSFVGLETNNNDESQLKIFQAELVDGKWKKLKEFPFNSDNYSTAHPTLSQDGKRMYFISDMPSGFGGTDLYVTEMKDGSWQTPINLGPTINSPGNELFPYIHSDGSLYFSSDAHNTMGGLDVFISYFDGENWARPENLNYPVNTPQDDFGFNLNPDSYTGFVSSSRSGKDGVYQFSKNDPKFVLYGRATKKGTEEPVADVVVEITDAETNKTVAVKSGEDGKFKLPLDPEKEYLLLCTKVGCFARTDKIVTKGLKYSEDFYADFIVEEIVVDKPIVLENIYYDYDKWSIRKDAAKELDKLAKLLKDNPKIEIELGSHTDSRGSDNYNMILSDKRAASAVYYLFKRGIDPIRMTWKGYGESVLVNKCENDVKCTEEEHQQNRRTEFKVTKINP